MAELQQSSEISISIHFDENKIPANITWQASSSTSPVPQQAKAFLLSLWDPTYKETLRIDLWTKDMQMDEMNAFFFQSFLTMADVYKRSNNDEAIAEEIRDFAFRFGEKTQVVKRK
ncbi:MAG: gliding motility protein GldC [Chitinophagales bacterium]